MHPSPDTPPTQYWDSVAHDKQFSFPLRREWLAHCIDPQARILDFGCGYGRTLAELSAAGYENSIGVDFSFGMLARCRSQFPSAKLIQNFDQIIPLRSNSVDAILLIAVLTCIPRDENQLALIREIKRVLCPGGVLYLGDFLLNTDARNRNRYERFAGKYGAYGTFELPEGVVLRHHRREWIDQLTASFERLESELSEVTTMNGNRSAAFQYLLRAPK